MANKRSETSKYRSRYGESRWVSAPQWLAELMCERRARQEGTSLPPSFWKTDDFWKDFYKRQVIAASSLVKRFDPEGTGDGAAAIAEFLRSERGKTCWSLSGAWIVPCVREALVRIRTLRKNRDEEIARPPETPPATLPEKSQATEAEREGGLGKNTDPREPTVFRRIPVSDPGKTRALALRLTELEQGRGLRR